MSFFFLGCMKHIICPILYATKFAMNLTLSEIREFSGVIYFRRIFFLPSKEISIPILSAINGDKPIMSVVKGGSPWALKTFFAVSNYIIGMQADCLFKT